MWQLSRYLVVFFEMMELFQICLIVYTYLHVLNEMTYEGEFAARPRGRVKML